MERYIYLKAREGELLMGDEKGRETIEPCGSSGLPVTDSGAQILILISGCNHIAKLKCNRALQRRDPSHTHTLLHSSSYLYAFIFCSYESSLCS